jgi:hypothetical protein
MKIILKLNLLLLFIVGTLICGCDNQKAIDYSITTVISNSNMEKLISNGYAFDIENVGKPEVTTSENIDSTKRMNITITVTSQQFQYKVQVDSKGNPQKYDKTAKKVSTVPGIGSTTCVGGCQGFGSNCGNNTGCKVSGTDCTTAQCNGTFCLGTCTKTSTGIIYGGVSLGLF